MQTKFGKRASESSLPDSCLEQPPVRKKPRRTSSRKKNLSQHVYTETSYYIRDGLRCVKPYYFTFSTHAKGRWVGRSLHNVLCQEFLSETPEYYERAITSGRVTVNGGIVDKDYRIRHNDLLAHRVHRHEPPVAALPVNIIHEDDEIIVVDKPSSIPVHPCGRYRHNTIVFILGREHNIENLHTVHRLDRLTSGLLLFAKSLATSQRMEQQIRQHLLVKEYVCRVLGEFPETEVECNEPILVVCHKIGVCRVDPAGKPCSTTFTRLCYDGSTSLIKCVPKTGRMHQIRVHLQWLGFPVLNDPLYNHPAWGSQTGRRGEGIQDIQKVLSEIVASAFGGELQTSREDGHVSDSDQDPDTICSSTIVSKTQSATRKSMDEEKLAGSSGDKLVDETELEASPNSSHSSKHGSGFGERTTANLDQNDSSASGSQRPAETNRPQTKPDNEQSAAVDTISQDERDPNCTECVTHHPDPTSRDLVMYLHALRYQGPGWEYSTALPVWADPDWKQP